jgi:hypothetical protein
MMMMMMTEVEGVMWQKTRMAMVVVVSTVVDYVSDQRSIATTLQQVEHRRILAKMLRAVIVLVPILLVLVVAKALHGNEILVQ